jgi:hypothetical protein
MNNPSANGIFGGQLGVGTKIMVKGKSQREGDIFAIF